MYYSHDVRMALVNVITLNTLSNCISNISGKAGNAISGEIITEVHLTKSYNTTCNRLSSNSIKNVSSFLLTFYEGMLVSAKGVLRFVDNL